MLSERAEVRRWALQLLDPVLDQDHGKAYLERVNRGILERMFGFGHLV